MKFLYQETKQWRDTCGKDIAHHVVKADIKEDEYSPPHGPVLKMG
jgi:hypothetical protein